MRIEYKVETNYPSQAFFQSYEQAEFYLESFIEKNNRYEIRVTKADIKKVERSRDPYGKLSYGLIENLKEWQIGVDNF